MTYKPDFAELTAYVDGELDADRAARVAEAIAADRALAHEVAALLRLKSATADAYDAAPPPLPGARHSALSAGPWRLAAAVVAVLVAAAAIVPLVLGKRSPLPAEEIASLVELWRTELAHERPADGVQSAAASREQIPHLLAEGLAAARLQVLAQRPAAGGLALSLRGPSGCRLALWVGPAETDLARSLRLTSQLSAGAAIAWTEGGWRYLIVSLNTPADKMTALAYALETRIRAPAAHEEALAVVAEARRVSSPCIG